MYLAAAGYLKAVMVICMLTNRQFVRCRIKIVKFWRCGQYMSLHREVCKLAIDSWRMSCEDSSQALFACIEGRVTIGNEGIVKCRKQRVVCSVWLHAVMTSWKRVVGNDKQPARHQYFSSWRKHLE